MTVMCVVVVDNEDGVCAEAGGDGDSLLCVVRRPRRLRQDRHRQNARLHRLLRRAGIYHGQLVHAPLRGATAECRS